MVYIIYTPACVDFYVLWSHVPYPEACQPPNVSYQAQFRQIEINETKMFSNLDEYFLHVMACSSSTQRPAGLAEPLIIKYLSQSSFHPSTLSSIFKSTSSNIYSSFTSSSSSSSPTTCWHLSVSYQMPLSNLHNIPLPLYFKLLKLNTIIAIMI